MRIKMTEEQLFNDGWVIGKTISNNVVVWERGHERLVYDRLDEEVVDVYFAKSTFISFN